MTGQAAKPANPTIWCQKCGYVLDGLSENRCPECGREFDPAKRRTFRRRPMRTKWFFLGRLALGIAGLTPILATAILVLLWRPIFDQRAWREIDAWTDGTDFRPYRSSRSGRSRSRGPVGMAGGWRGHLARLIRLYETGPTTDAMVTKFDEEGISRLAGLKALEKLTLDECLLSEAAFGHLQRLSRLRALSIRHTTFTEPDAGLAKLGGLKSLRDLRIYDACITDDGLAHLKDIPSLEVVQLSPMSPCAEASPKNPRPRIRLGVSSGPQQIRAPWGFCGNPKQCTGITGEGLAHLAELPNLRELIISNPVVSDRNLSRLGRPPQLKRIAIQSDLLSDAGLVHLSKITSLESIVLKGQFLKIHGTGIRHLVKLPNLKDLTIRFSSFVPPDGPGWPPNLAYLADLRKLEKLDINHMTNPVMAQLADHDTIKELHLHPYEIDQELLSSIARLSKLTDLDLSFCRIEREGFAHLAKLQGLETLDLESTTINHKGLSYIGRIASLKRLNLRTTGFADAGMKHLAGLKNLEWLNLSLTRITDASIPALLRLPRLEILYSNATHISSEGLKKLRSKPNLRVGPPRY
jgi:Leucine-rich repeat (LRR) protein